MVYVPKDVYTKTRNWTVQGGGVGLLAASVQNALGTHSQGAAGLFTRYGSTITTCAVTAATFALTESLVANHREKDDVVNPAVAGCAVGFLAGIRQRSLPTALASCALLGGAMAGLEYAGGLTGDPTASAATTHGRATFFKQPKEPWKLSASDETSMPGLEYAHGSPENPTSLAASMKQPLKPSTSDEASS